MALADNGLNPFTKIYTWTYADATARGAETPAPADVGSIAWQVDDDSFWVLTDDSPLTWVQLNGGGGGGGAALTVQEADGSPSDTAVTVIKVPNGWLTNNGAGDVTVSPPQRPPLLVERWVAPSGGAASKSFTIPSGWKTIRWRANARSERSNDFDDLNIRPNNDSGANYLWTMLQASGSTVTGNPFTAQTEGFVGSVVGANAAAARRNSGWGFIASYDDTSIQKSYQFASVAPSASSQRVQQGGGAWASTAAITSLVFFCTVGDIAEGSIIEVWVED